MGKAGKMKVQPYAKIAFNSVDPLKFRGLREKVQEALARCPEMYEGVLSRAFSGVASPRSAIKAKCLDCMGFENARNRIIECSVFSCPLWPYRPYQETCAKNKSTDQA